MGDYSPKFKPGADVTQTASAAITGGQLLVVSGANTVAPTGGSTLAWCGVARQDAASGEKVVVTRGGVHPLIASGAIAAGARVVPAAGGAVQTIAANPAADAVGTALQAASGGTVLVWLDR